ncbi:BRISC complex subunit abraxas 2-like [Ylistrum balloti]|uniref:BRISC complex subunit abraxas 2-like n=1 Tax=Ylistrum balloti TaxID=509963 RepID=UPI0029059882|nr:BRISC complex subunit abraxas 2-like [Ylistrum balloti]
MAAIISGPVLASLFYDQSRCSGDQEGLLIGKVSHSVKDTISDSQINNYKVETKLYIYSCHELQRGTNQSRKDQLQKCITEQIKIHGEKCIVGWYHSRRNTAPRLSMRERSIHHTLVKSLSSQGREDFYFLLCTSSNTLNRSTHNFDFGFYKLNKDDADFAKVPITVVNLEDTTNNQYKLDSTCTASASSGIYASVISKFQSEILDKSGQVQEVKKISSLESTLQEKLQDLTRGVDQSERELHALEQEVRQRRQLIEVKLEKERNMKTHSQTPPPAYDDKPILKISSVTPEEAVSIAKQKREQRRRENNKSLLPNMSSGRPSSAKSKTDQVHPLTRRLSSELDEPSATHSHRLSDEIAFIDEDVPEVTDHEEMDTKSDDELKSGENLEDQTNTQGSGVILLPHQGQTVQLTLPDMNVPEMKRQTIPTVTLNHPAKTDSVNKDHFSFVSGLLAEEKTKPVKSKTVENSNKHVNSMSVPIGGHITAPLKSSSQAAAAVGAAVAAAAKGNKDEELSCQSSRLQKQQLTTSAVLNVNNKGQRSRAKQSQPQTSRSRSKEGGKRKDTSAVCLDRPSSKDTMTGAKNNLTNHDQDSQSSSHAVCRLEANIEQMQNFEEDETEDIHKINDHGQLDNFKISSSPVF